MILDMLYQSFYCANFSELSRLPGDGGREEGERDKGFLSSFLPSPAPLEVVRYVVMTTEGWKGKQTEGCELHSVLRNPLPSPQNETSSAVVARDEVEGCSRQISLFILLSLLFFAPD